jgi:hypothetical protein
LYSSIVFKYEYLFNNAYESHILVSVRNFNNRIVIELTRIMVITIELVNSIRSANIDFRRI